MGLLDGVGAIFAPRPRPPKDHDRARHRDSYADHDQARSSRRARRNTYDHPQHYHRHSPSPADAPDVDHLRQARAEYYARPPEQRTRRPSAPAATPARPNHRHDMEPRRAMSTRKHPKSKRHEDDRRTNRKEREDRDSGVYVYSTPRSGGSRNRQEDVGDSRSRAGPHRRTVSSPAAQNIIDVEVEREPEPSVRREDGVRISRYGVLALPLLGPTIIDMDQDNVRPRPSPSGHDPALSQTDRHHQVSYRRSTTRNPPAKPQPKKQHWHFWPVSPYAPARHDSRKEVGRSAPRDGLAAYSAA